jgi:hypothetical protein
MRNHSDTLAKGALAYFPVHATYLDAVAFVVIQE